MPLHGPDYRYSIGLILNVEGIEGTSSIYEADFHMNNRVLICLRCGSVWGKILSVVYDWRGNRENVSWFGEMSICRSCGEGSLLQPRCWMDYAFRKYKGFSLSQNLVARELELIWEKENINGLCPQNV